MSSSNCCFLIFIQVSQEAGKVAWYSHLFQNFPQFVVIHTVKGFGIINRTEVDFVCNSLAFFDGTTVVHNLISGFSTFSKSSLNIWNPWFSYCWSLAWRILSITLLACEMSAIVWQFEHSLSLPFLGIEINTDFFQSCVHCWVFQICWHTDNSTLISSSLFFFFRETDPNSLFSMVYFYTLRCYAKVMWGQQSWLLSKSGASYKCIQRS